METERLAYRYAEAAERLGLGYSTLRALVAKGELETIRIGRARLIPAAALAAFLEQRRALAGGGLK